MGTKLGRIAGAAWRSYRSRNRRTRRTTAVELPHDRGQPDHRADAGQQIANSITVVTGRGPAARAAPHGHRRAQHRARPQCRAERLVRRADLGVHPRHQFQPRQGADRRHRRQRLQQSERRLRFRPSAHLRHRADRGAARPAKRPLRRDAIGGVISITTKRAPARPRSPAWSRVAPSARSTRRSASAARRTGSTTPSTSRISATTNQPVTPAYMVPPGGHAIGNAYDNKIAVDQARLRRRRESELQFHRPLHRRRCCIIRATIRTPFPA